MTRSLSPLDRFALVPALCWALDLVLAQPDSLLDDEKLVQRVTADLRRRMPHTATRGRMPTPRL